MSIIPKRALIVNQTRVEETGWIGFTDDPTGEWVGYAKEWKVFLSVTPLANSGATPSYSYNATNISVGDWIATSAGGIAVRIKEIVEVPNRSNIVVIAEDVDLYNILNDPTYSGQGIGPNVKGAIFPVDEITNYPILGPISSYELDLNLQMDLFARFVQQQEIKGGSGSDTLGSLSTSYDAGAIMGWQPTETLKDEAISDLNVMFRKILPDAYNNLSDTKAFFSEDDKNGRKFVLAAGTIEHFDSSYAPVAGDIVEVAGFTTATTTIESAQFANGQRTLAVAGPGHIGKLTYSVNGTQRAEKTLSWASNVGNNGGLNILSDQEVTEHKDVWKALSIQLTGPFGDGSNQLKLTHSISGTLTKNFVVDETNKVPTITSVSLGNAGSTPELKVISGIPHYYRNLSELFMLTMTGTNLVSRTYPLEDIMGVELEFTNPFNTSYDAADLTSTPFVIDAGPINATNKIIGFDIIGLPEEEQPVREAFESKIIAYANNSFRTITRDTNQTILVYDGDGQFIAETPSSNSMNYGLKRQAMPSGRTPVLEEIDWATDYDSSTGGDTKAHEAVITGGVIKHSKTNYSVGYWPAGPDYSTKSDTQYISFKTQLKSNRLRLSIDGTFEGISIMLPGITNEMPNAINGWWNGSKQADFPQTLWPGHALASDGCLVSSSNGTYEFTFGNINSSSATEHMVFIRFELIAGQSISVLQLIES